MPRLTSCAQGHLRPTRATVRRGFAGAVVLTVEAPAFRRGEYVTNVQPKKDGLAKAYQVRQFLKLIDSHNLQLESEDESDE